jgi:ppGpp synthetase/RelA/SpoT-type nucleotidyltranferase
LQSTANYVVQRLQTVPQVHSLMVRLKDPDHLMAKIVRKKLKLMVPGKKRKGAAKAVSGNK